MTQKNKQINKKVQFLAEICKLLFKNTKIFGSKSPDYAQKPATLERFKAKCSCADVWKRLKVWKILQQAYKVTCHEVTAQNLTSFVCFFNVTLSEKSQTKCSFLFFSFSFFCGAAAAPSTHVLFGGWGMPQYFTLAPNILVWLE